MNHQNSFTDIQAQPTNNPLPSADHDIDYIAADINATLFIPAGSSTASATVKVVDDSLVEDDFEIFELKLVPNPSSLPDCVLDPPDRVIIQIQDDDCKFENDVYPIQK